MFWYLIGWNGGVSAALNAKFKIKSEKLDHLASKSWGEFVNEKRQKDRAYSLWLMANGVWHMANGVWFNYKLLAIGYLLNQCPVTLVI